MSGGLERVILAEDHTLVRAGIRSLLEARPDIEIVAETGDGHQALRLVRELEPDLLLLDITLPGMNGLEVAARIRRRGPAATRVVMLSMHTRPEYVARALEAGAVGYLTKDSAVVELEDALAAVRVGRRYLSPGIDEEVVRRFRKASAGPDAELAVLTPRQRQILQLIAEGHGTREIAERLHISVKTVETHRAQLMERLGVSDVPGLVRFAIRVGLIETDG